MLVSFIILENKEPEKDNLKRGGSFFFSFVSVFKIFQSVANWTYASRPMVSQSTVGVKRTLQRVFTSWWRDRERHRGVIERRDRETEIDER